MSEQDNHKIEGLSKKAVRGTFWLFLLRIADGVFRFTKTVILAHILSPHDFGLFGIAFIAIVIVDSFSQTGFQQALIRHKKEIKPYLDTAWIIQIFRGFVLAFILFFLSPLVANLFGVSEASAILQVIALSMIIQGFSNIGLVYFQRDIEMNKYFAYQSIGIVADFTVSVVLAIILRNVWALVIGFVASDIVKLLISYAFHDYRPRFKFDADKAKELFHFGKWIFSSNIISFFLLQGDSIFVEKLLGVASLGFYQVGSRISSITDAEVISGAIFPIFSKIQDDPARMRAGYFKISEIMLFILFPATFGLIAIAPEFTRVILGTQWLPSVTVIRLLSLTGLIWSLPVISVPIFSAIGKPKIETKYNLIKIIVLFISLFPFIKLWGIPGAAFAALLSIAISSAGIIFETFKIIKADLKSFLRLVSMPFLNSFLMLIFVLVSKMFIQINYFGIFLMVFLGLIYYSIFIWLSGKFLNYKIFRTIKENIKILAA